MPKSETRRILLCDGKSSRRDTIASRFRLQGFAVELSPSGFQTLSMIEKGIYDALIIFEQTQDMSGFELLSLARNIYQKEDLPIIFVGKNISQDQILSHFHAGANDYLIYSETIFGSLLEKILQTKSSSLKTPKKGMQSKYV